MNEHCPVLPPTHRPASARAAHGRRAPRWIALGVALAAACTSRSAPSPTAPGATASAPAPDTAATAPAAFEVPAQLRFASPQTTGLFRLSFASVRDSRLLGPVFHAQLGALSQQLPACEASLWQRADTILVATSPGPNAGDMVVRVRVLGGLEHAVAQACLDSLAAAGVFRLQPLESGGVQLLDAGGDELISVLWVDGGIEFRRSTDSAGSGGPTLGSMQELLGKVDVDGPLWLVAEVDPRLGQHTESGSDRFERAWLEVVADSQLRLRAGMRLFSEAAAETAPEELITAILEGAKGRLPMDVDSLKDRLRLRRDGRWVFVDASWTYDELEQLFQQAAGAASDSQAIAPDGVR